MRRGNVLHYQLQSHINTAYDLRNSLLSVNPSHMHDFKYPDLLGVFQYFKTVNEIVPKSTDIKMETDCHVQKCHGKNSSRVISFSVIRNENC